MPSSHALLSPSSAKRWMACAPSARAEGSCSDEQTSYSREGTLAHSCAEQMLKFYRRGYEPMDYDRLPKFGPISDADEIRKECEALGIDFDEMCQTVHDYYVLPIYEDFRDAKARYDDARLLVEAQLDLSSYIPEGYGTADAVIISEGRVDVYDLKYGKGVRVEADNNPQMRCYALGVLCGPAELEEVKEVGMHIVQPRLRHFSDDEMLYDDLVSWGKFVLRPAAQRAYAGEGEYVAGGHCKFRKFAPRCRALYLSARVTAEAQSRPQELSDDELARALYELESVKIWTNRVEEYATKYLLSGASLPGWKLVEGRSVRKITDEKGAAKELSAQGFDDSQIYKPLELRSLSDLEKMLGRKGKEVLEPYITRNPGKPTLAPSSDARREFSASENDFSSLCS